MTYVTKVNGERELFNKQKIYETCKRAGVSERDARRISDEVEKIVYEGISTKELLKAVLKKLDAIEQRHALKYDLRNVVSKLTEEDEFEKYVQHLLIAQGYKTEWNVILKGELVEHQIDIIAEKNNKKYFIECKHHLNPHRFCGLQTVLQTWAAFDDLQKGGAEFEKGWLINNTKISEHALRYAKGKNLLLTAWNYPDNDSLRDWIADKGLYPITILNVPAGVRKMLKNAGILLLRELIDTELDTLVKKTGIKRKILSKLAETAKMVLKS